MSAYVIAQLDVHDMAEFEKYLAGFYAIFEPRSLRAQALRAALSGRLRHSRCSLRTDVSRSTTMRPSAPSNRWS